MTTTDIDAIIADYLQRLDAELHNLPAFQRRQLVTEIGAHLQEARLQLPDESEASVLNLLDRVGRPEDIAAEAIADQPMHASRPPRSWLRVGLVALVVAGIGAGVAVAIADGGHATHAPPTTAISTPPTPTTIATVLVPVVIGRTAADAGSILALAGFKVSMSSRSRNAIPPGEVVSQDPAAGTAVTSGTNVEIEVSSGSITVTTPQVPTSS